MRRWLSAKRDARGNRIKWRSVQNGVCRKSTVPTGEEARQIQSENSSWTLKPSKCHEGLLGYELLDSGFGCSGAVLHWVYLS